MTRDRDPQRDALHLVAKLERLKDRNGQAYLRGRYQGRQILVFFEHATGGASVFVSNPERGRRGKDDADG